MKRGGIAVNYRAVAGVIAQAHQAPCGKLSGRSRLGHTARTKILGFRDGGDSMKPPARKLRGVVDHTTEAKRLRDRAGEWRSLARMMTSEGNAASLLRFADTYDALAEQQEQLARDGVSHRTQL